LNNDSMPDVLLSTRIGPDSTKTYNWMSVKGSDGTHFWQHSKTGNGTNVWAENVGDVDGDSKPDFLLTTSVNNVGDSRTAQAIMKSGSDGTNLWQTVEVRKRRHKFMADGLTHWQQCSSLARGCW